MNLAYFETDSEEQKQLKPAFPNYRLTVLPDVLTEETAAAAQDAELLSVFVNSKVTAKVIEEMPNLRFVSTRSTGFDHIDLDACKKRNILVSNVPTYGENTVAEHSFALILTLSRKIFLAYERTERMDFDREGLQGFDLLGKTLGVVGTGNIGKHVIRIGNGFSMNVIAFDVKQDPKLAEELNFTYANSLNELLSQSDIITLHVPYLPATHHLINKENINDIKIGAILINTARGALIDTEALLMALDKKILSGAGLDVIEGEDDTYELAELLSKGTPKNKDIATILRNHVLIARDDVVITPHNAFNSIEAVQRIFDTNVRNIRSFVEGNPVNLVEKK